MYYSSAIFDNRRQKVKWAITPFVGMACIFIFCMVPMIWYVKRNTRELVAIFYFIIIPLSGFGFWYLVSIPSIVVIDPNFILFDRCVNKELVPTINIKKVLRTSRGILYLRMMDGRIKCRMGIDDAIIDYLVQHINHLDFDG